MPRPNSTSQKAKPSKSVKAKGLKDIRLDEEVKIAVHLSLEGFQYSEDKELQFPSSFTSTERAFVHRLARSLGYVSKSQGKGIHRFLTIRKKGGSAKSQSILTFDVTLNSKHVVRSLLQRFPITHKEQIDLLPCTERGLSVTLDADSSRDKIRTSGRLNSGIPQVPAKKGPSELESFRRSLPVFPRQEEIVTTIRENQVVLVIGETGSGKTTQIPQFLLDDCTYSRTPCRIYCTQPRRLAVIAVAERVAAERGEGIGQTVGYQIHLESRISPKTLLTFCTSGVLLRTLMGGDNILSTVTHIIVDEVHERDGLTDFLLIKLRDALRKMPSLRLVLSSAALDVDLFLRYFGTGPVIYLKGRPHEVKQLFLEDVLRTTGYTNKDMMKYKMEKQKEEKQQSSLTQWCAVKEEASCTESLSLSLSTSCILQENNLLDDEGHSAFNQQNEKDVSSLEPWLVKEMDACISAIFLEQKEEAFIQLFNLVLTENISVDYRHSETSATPLMVAAGRGFLNQMEQLLGMGASVHIKASNGWTALDWAKHFKQTAAVDLLESNISSLEAGQLDEASLMLSSHGELSVEDQELLKAYHHSFDDEKVDLDLIMHLLHRICQNSDEGAVLIFLPGYDEIVGLRDRILYDDKRFADQHRYQLFLLHSNMQTSDQRKVLRPVPTGVRKIILSTNIAETSITVNDVVFVIDSGKVKEKAYDALNHVTMLKMVWISKASALQRKGRAGRCRPGICFHLFSQIRFNSMLEHQVPQLLRMPLQELCLHTKLLAPVGCPIAEFLAKAPDPPHQLAVKNAVQILKTIDAMDQWEDLTELGFHLADLPVEPHLGKMVLCGVVLRCLDPVLTIVCSLAYRDPFMLPAQASQKRAAMLCRKRFSANTFSDHMAFLRVFQAWQEARAKGWERDFCTKNFLSQATMEIIIGTRTQLMGHLRATGFVRARGNGDIREVNQNSENWAVVKAALVAGSYPSLVHVERANMTLSGAKEKKVRFHQSSVLSQAQDKKVLSANGQAEGVQSLPTDWLIYEEMTRAHHVASARCCTMVTPLTVAVFGGCARLPKTALQQPAVASAAGGAGDENSDSENEECSSAELAQMKIDEWLNFRLDCEMAELVFQLRQRWQCLFLRRIRSPSKPWSQLDEATICTLVSVLVAEEQAAGLQQPTGIGQRPRSMAPDEPPQHSFWRKPQGHRSSAEAEHGEVTSGAERPSRLSPAPSRPREQKDKDTAQSKRCTGRSIWTKSDSPGLSSSSGSASSMSSVKEKPWGSVTVSPRPSATVRYFIMKSSNMRNIELSQQKGIWSTTTSNEYKLSQAFQQSSAVVLVFSVQGSGHFQGYARMSSDISCERWQDWGSTGLGGVFSVEWIRKEHLPFQHTQQILNPWNDNKRVQISRDGQELESRTGEFLLQLWDCTSAKDQPEL